ncbi:hypothetical protein JW848_06835 [Candidatus Bipolaricaulota bacterium]|nr:hypothetical protein [Candidatus Bipolaricaulota bacterium]
MNGTSPQDLLTLIGRATERLRSGAVLIEEAKRTEGIEELTAVVSDIDAYLDVASRDPLLQLASIDHAILSSQLSLVRSDIQAVVEALAVEE